MCTGQGQVQQGQIILYNKTSDNKFPICLGPRKKRNTKNIIKVKCNDPPMYLLQNNLAWSQIDSN